jgi:hypothetical protein
MRSIVCALLIGASALAGCATYTEDLNRGQQHFEANEYERALAVWRVLETDLDSLTPMDRARYAYLRGMTDYRMGFRADARHWLALARAIEKETPGGLQASWKDRTEEALKDLDKDVFGGAEASDDSASPAGSGSAPAGAPPASAPAN